MHMPRGTSTNLLSAHTVPMTSPDRWRESPSAELALYLRAHFGGFPALSNDIIQMSNHNFELLLIPR
jgi:hypothetical protein